MPRVLIVDDDTSVRSILATSLTRPDRRIDFAEDGVEALERVARCLPDAIVTDVMMPRMDGWALVKRLRSTPETAFVPVIFLTGLDAVEDRILGFKLGGDDFVTKPVDLVELSLRLDSALRHARREQSPASGLRGCLADVGISTVLNVLALERRSGELVLARGAATARLLVRDGDIVNASMDDGPTGAECVYGLFSWAEGVFAFAPRAVDEPDRIGASTTALLLEAARRSDEDLR